MDRSNWSWSVGLPGVQQQPWQRGTGNGLQECREEFVKAWHILHASLTDANVEDAYQYERSLKNRS